MIMYTGDREPDLKVTVENADPDGPGVDLTGLTIRMLGLRDGVKVFDHPPDNIAVVGLKTELTMAWANNDNFLDEVGDDVEIEVEITWPGDKKQTVRTFEVIDIREDVDKLVA